MSKHLKASIYIAEKFRDQESVDWKCADTLELPSKEVYELKVKVRKSLPINSSKVAHNIFIQERMEDISCLRRLEKYKNMIGYQAIVNLSMKPWKRGSKPGALL